MAKCANIKTAALLLTAALTLAPQAVSAFSLSHPWGDGPQAKKQVFDEQRKQLIWSVSHDPALMNLQYLEISLGPPANEMQEHGLMDRHYVWYDPNNFNQPLYELIQHETAPGQITQSELICELQGTGLTFDQVDKQFGKESRRFYDYSGHPNELFTFAPNTYLSFGCLPNGFHLAQAHILYRGAPLAEPSQDEISDAKDAMIEKARVAAMADRSIYDKLKPGQLAAGMTEGAVGASELIPLLMARVKADPMDPEAHLMLAQAFHRQAHLNEALSEYKIALAMAGDNDDVRKQALEALHNMGVMMPDDPIPQRRNLEIVDNGQHLRVEGNEKDSRENNDRF